MARKLRLNSETLKVLSQSQAQRVVGANGGTEDTCATVTSTDYTWIWCDYCRQSCTVCLPDPTVCGTETFVECTGVCTF